MKRIVFVSIFFAFMFGALSLLISKTSSPDNQIMNNVAIGYSQLNEYANDLDKSLNAVNEENKIRSALTSFTKIQIAKDAIFYLKPILDAKGIDISIIEERLTVMTGNSQELIYSIYKRNIPENLIESLNKDSKDAKFIFESLNYKWIEEGNFDKIKESITTIQKQLISN